MMNASDHRINLVKNLLKRAVDRAVADGILDTEGIEKLLSDEAELEARAIRLIRELSMPNQYADEEVRAAYGYPREYKGAKPIEAQIKAIAEIFNLDPAQTLEYQNNLPALPQGAEGWFAIPSVDVVCAKHFPEIQNSAEKYCRVLQMIHQKIAAQRSFYNYRDGQIDTAHIRVSTRTVEMMQKIAETQKGEILIIAAQLGKRHGGRSIRRAREVFVANEYGLTSVAIGSIILVHPERLVRWEELDMDCAGDEFCDGDDGQFDRAPCWYFDNWAKFVTEDVSNPDGYFGSASGFLAA